MDNNQNSISINYYVNGLKYNHWEIIEDNCSSHFIDDGSLDCSDERYSDNNCSHVYGRNNYKSKYNFCNICSPGPAGVSGCKYCTAGLRAVLGYLKNVGATDIIVETIASQPAVNNQSVIRFYPDANNVYTAKLVQFSNGEIVSICQIELIQSTFLIDSSSDFMRSTLKAALDTTVSEIPKGCKQCCQEQLRTLFASNIGNAVSNIDTSRNNVISGQGNIVRATGASTAVISLPGNDGAAVNLYFVSSVSF
ncbi:hypothetical protein ACJDU8_13425 [Clostridium sp. WILCCON 0269]|uniref:Uncharacterized protein n=1 Tax=Candidatus Clostridium eludens TaxID=3381663 RepID=A0ABW8SLP0_9CLOT